MRSSWWRVTQPAKASTRKCRAWGMAGGYMAQTRPSPTLSRGFTRLGRFLAPYGVEPGHPGAGRGALARAGGPPGSGGAGALRTPCGRRRIGGDHRARADRRCADRADPDRCDRRRSHERHGRWSRPSCPGGPGRWGAATPRHIIPATNACLGRRATGSIRAVRWRQSRQRRRIASSATRMRGWVRGWVSTSAGSTRA